ncbi:MAG: bifunctional 4-hydroxy-2-oxoglutarate aldolase/2-dehydro-3-deoxy-phosphogluconate aldolase [Ignavibacteriales bacterium]|nr:bifunctional 4-hydroxy-2-oxoglutarate aldolase/2-dehydro-3-deoxy-phosphogluconate aldolase [Ignavibacteriales bacterium]
MSEVLKRIGEIRLVPVVILEDAKNAEPLAEALIAGGLPCAEVTFRTAAAAESIKRISTYKEICLGAGTVLSVDQVKLAIDSGATFIVSPGLNPKVVMYCVDNKIPITPGICTPTEIEIGLEHGLNIFKFFPAEAYGGLKTLKAISAPYGMIKFIPTGGIGPKNVRDYLSLKQVFACGGSWMVTKEMISNGQFKEITALVKEAANLIKGI